MEKKFQHNGFEGAYLDEGEGKVVVLVHGFPEDSRVWEAQVDYLKKAFRVIAPDLPGSGEAALIEDLTIDLMADYVFALLSELKVTECVMIGHSMGGYITLAFAEKYPQLIRGIGLLHSHAEADTEDKKESRRKAIDLMEEYGSEAFVRQMVPNLFTPIFKMEKKMQFGLFFHKASEMSKESLQAYYKAMMQRPDRVEVIRNTKIPVLFVLGKEDAAAAPEKVLAQVHLPLMTDIHLMDNVAHMGMLEAPEKINNIFFEFFQNCYHEAFQINL